MENGGKQELDRIGTAPTLDASRLQRLATLFAEQFMALYDYRPADPLVTVSGTHLTFMFQGGLSAADERLLSAGREQEVRDFRENFMRATSTRFESIVASLLEADVTFSFAAFDPGSRTTSCFFVLDYSGA